MSTGRPGPPRASLHVVAGPAVGTEIPIADLLLIGRAVEGPGSLGADHGLSRSHARVTRMREGNYVLEDLGSTNGTYLNEELLTGPQPLHRGDRVRIGDSEFGFEVD